MKNSSESDVFSVKFPTIGSFTQKLELAPKNYLTIMNSKYELTL